MAPRVGNMAIGGGRGALVLKWHEMFPLRFEYSGQFSFDVVFILPVI